MSAGESIVQGPKAGTEGTDLQAENNEPYLVVQNQVVLVQHHPHMQAEALLLQRHRVRAVPLEMFKPDADCPADDACLARAESGQEGDMAPLDEPFEAVEGNGVRARVGVEEEASDRGIRPPYDWTPKDLSGRHHTDGDVVGAEGFLLA